MSSRSLVIFTLGGVVHALQRPICTDHTDLTRFPGPDGRCDGIIQNAADWDRRRKDILVGFAAVAGTLPARENLPPLDVQIVDTKVLAGGVRRLNLTYDSGEANAQMRVPAFLYLPPATAIAASPGGKAPCILASHPTSVAGKKYAEIRSPPLDYAVELAERGYAVVQPDYPSMGGMRGYNFTRAEADGSWASGTLKAVWDNMRAIDLLEARNDTNIDQLAAIGHSSGGHNSLFTSVLDERIKVVVSSCGWTPWQYYVLHAPLARSWALPKYMPRISTVFHDDIPSIPFDFYELVAAIAPRPFFSNSPYTDFNFNVSGVWATVPKVRPIWKLFDAEGEGSLHVEYPAGGCMSEGGSHDCGHDFPAGTRLEAYQFIDRHLGVSCRPVVGKK